MICQRCHRSEAVIRYAEVVDGRVSHLMLCPACHAEVVQGGSAGFEIAGKAPLRRVRSARSMAEDPATALESCPSCGVEWHEILDRSRVGCAQCYDNFAPKLRTVLRDMHIGTRHIGKRPRFDDSRERFRSELQTKRSLLRSALDAEDYEEAARLRDGIRDLEAALDGLSSESGASCGRCGAQLRNASSTICDQCANRLPAVQRTSRASSAGPSDVEG